MAPLMALGRILSFLGQIFCPIFYMLNFEVSHGKVISKLMARLNKAGTGLKGMPNFCKGHQGLSDYPIWTIYWLFWVNHFGTRTKHSQGDQSAMVLKENTDTGIQKQGHTVEGMWTRILFQLVSSWNPVPCQSNMNWLIWLPNPDCVIRSDAHDFMSIWGFRFFFWSILLISSNFHILSRMMMIYHPSFLLARGCLAKGSLPT